MKKKTAAILSSCAAIAVCSSLIVGSTYALFTSESKVDITVKSGKVDVVAEVAENTLALTSMGEEQTLVNDDGEKLWANGGTAGFNDNEELELTNITPGDGLTFNIKVTNNSTVNVKYKISWSVSGALADVLKADATGAKFDSWTEWTIPANDSDKVKTVSVSVELPEEVGNAYQEKSADITFAVEAVQGNAEVKDVHYASNTAEAQALLDNATDGDTIILKANNTARSATTEYGTLEIGTTENSAVSYVPYGEMVDGIHQMYLKVTERSIGSVKIIAEDGVTVDGIKAYTRVSDLAAAVVENVDGVDYKVGKTLTKIAINKLELENLNLTKGVNLSGDDYSNYGVDGNYSGVSLAIGNLYMKNCSMNGNGTADTSANNKLLSYMGNSYYANIVVDGCTATNLYQGVYTTGNRNLTVKNCTFDTLGHNAIAVQNRGATNGGDIIISDNIVKNDKEKSAIRFGNFADGSVKITGNTFENIKEPNGELCKAESVVEGVEVYFANNYWDGKPVEQAVVNFDKAEHVLNMCEVTPENIDEYLSGMYGSLSNATLVLTPGEYGKITIGSPSQYKYGNSTYTCANGGHDPITFTDAEEFKAHWTGSYHHYPTYSRTIENLTIIGQEGVTVAGLSISSGGMSARIENDPISGATLSQGYALYQNLKNITFEGIAFTDKVDINTSHANTHIDGVTFDKCHFETGNTATNAGIGLRYYNEHNNGQVSNLTVTDCTFKNCYQGIYTGSICGIEVTGCSFDTTGHNAIAIQGGNAVDHKEIVITGNTFNNVGDRIIRFNNVGADTQIIIKDNTATDSGDEDGEVIKATSLAVGVTYDISGNNWGEGAKIANAELQDK